MNDSRVPQDLRIQVLVLDPRDIERGSRGATHHARWLSNARAELSRRAVQRQVYRDVREATAPPVREVGLCRPFRVRDERCCPSQSKRSAKSSSCG